MARSKPIIYKAFQFFSHKPADWPKEFASVAQNHPRALHVRTGAAPLHDKIHELEFKLVEDPRLKTEFWFAYEDKAR